MRKYLIIVPKENINSISYCVNGKYGKSNKNKLNLIYGSIESENTGYNLIEEVVRKFNISDDYFYLQEIIGDQI